MQVTWKDASSYSQSDKARVPNCYEYRGKRLRVVVVRHRDNPSMWSLVCHELGISTPRELDADLEKAKALALAHCIVELDWMAGDLGRALKKRAARRSP